MQLPPPPEVPPLPKGPTPPAAIVGVLSVPDVMRASTAFQQADKEFVARRQKLNEDAQKEQVDVARSGQALANERAKLYAEQIRAREKELQDRITNRAACSASATGSSRRPASTSWRRSTARWKW